MIDGVRTNPKHEPCHTARRRFVQRIRQLLYSGDNTEVPIRPLNRADFDVLID
jgi:hypothetical protein